MFPKAIQDFIERNLQRPLAEVSLKLSKKKTWPKAEILNQINGRQKLDKKFPFLKAVAGFIFPSARAFSQASSEKTARFKASLVQAKKMADLSGGMGIDSYFFSKNVSHLDYVETDETLYHLTTDNFKSLAAKNITTHHLSAEDFIISSGSYDLIYLDPDRRDKNKRLFLLEDCRPNIIELLPKLFEKTDRILLKLSPLIDIKSVLEKLPYVSDVWIVAVKNDCKELLFKLNKNLKQQPQINCFNLLEQAQQSFSFDYKSEQSAAVNYAAPLKYLYEPNVSINKAGAFNVIAQHFKLKKLAVNTHLYTSDELIENFPGRKLEVLKTEKPQKQKNLQANVISKNFPLSTASIRKKYQIGESKNRFLYACSLENKQSIFIHAMRIFHFQ